MIRLQPEEYAPLAQYIYSICAITLDHSKIVSDRGPAGPRGGRGGLRAVSAIARAGQSPTPAERWSGASWMPSPPEKRSSFATLHHSICCVQDHPGVDRPASEVRPTRLRIWSAACSTGQEIYSIAMLLKELLGDPDRYGVRLLGTDISDEAVARASRGFYTPVEMSRGLTRSSEPGTSFPWRAAGRFGTRSAAWHRSRS